MTNDNNTRKKANAVFFSVIMVLSMVAVGFAAMPAAAQANDHDDFTYSPPNPWQGQDVTADVDNPDAEYQLRRVTNTDDEGDTTSSQFVRDVTADSTDGDVTISTGNLDAGNYFISGNDLNQRPSEGNTFEVRIQDLDAEFDDNEVDNAGTTEVDLEIDSNRGTYSLNSSADGDLDEEELVHIYVENETVADALLHEDVRDEVTTDSDGLPNFDAADVNSALDTVTDGNVTDWQQDNPWNVLAYAEDEEDADEKVLHLGLSDQEEATDFDGIDEGDYEFTFEAVDTSAEATAEITVVDVDDGELDLVDATITEDVGETVSITVETVGAADSGMILIGDEDDFGYFAAIEIDTFGDTDEATIYFNTYTAGAESSDDFGNTFDSEEDVMWLDEDSEDDGVELAPNAFNQTADIDGILDAGDYDISVQAGATDVNDVETLEDVYDNPDNVGSMTLDDRSTDALATWTASDDVADDISDVDDLNERVGENVTQTDEIAYDDWVIHQIEASGLTGMMDAVGYDEDREEQFDQLVNDMRADSSGDNTANKLEFRLRETRDSAGPNVDRESLTIDADDLVVLTDDESDAIYVGIDTSDIELNEALDEEEDYELELRFRVQDARLLDWDSDEDDNLRDVYEQLDATYEVNERTAEWSEDPYNVTASDDVTFSGETNIAPGSEPVVRIRSSGDTRPSFIENEDALVDADGTFTSEEFDLSETSIGDTYTVSLRQANFPETPEVDGEIVDAVEEEETETPEETPEETEEPETEEPETEEPETEEPETEDPDTEEPETDDDTPGFGAVVALVALIAAALLATRRRP